MNIELEQKEVFSFRWYFTEPVENGWDEIYGGAEVRIEESRYGYTLCMKERNGQPCNLSIPGSAMDGLKRILSGLCWNYEYWGADRFPAREQWHLKMNLPDMRFRAAGYDAYPPDFERVRDAILREIEEIFRQHNPLLDMGTPGQSAWRIRTGQYTAYQARHDMHNKYYFYYDDRKLGSAVSLVSPGFPVTIEGEGLSLHTEITDTFPQGSCRTIWRQTGTGRAVIGRLERISQTECRLWAGSQCIRVRNNDWNVRFYLGDREIARLSRAGEEDRPYFILRSKVQLEYYMSIREPLSQDLALLLLSVPYLKIGL